MRLLLCDVSSTLLSNMDLAICRACSRRPAKRMAFSSTRKWSAGDLEKASSMVTAC